MFERFYWTLWSCAFVLGCTGIPMSLGGLTAAFDDTCIAGKLMPAGAKLLNDNPGSVNWHNDYTRLFGLAKANDRILGGHCAETIKAASGAAVDAVEGD